MQVARSESPERVGHDIQSPVRGPSFREVMSEVKDALMFEAGPGVERALGSIRPPYGDLLRMQVRIARYALTVELVAKAGDSASATFRRLQQA